MFRYKERFICEKCGRMFCEFVPDCIMPQTAELLRHPKCRWCRIKGLIGKATKKDRRN